MIADVDWALFTAAQEVHGPQSLLDAVRPPHPSAPPGSARAISRPGLGAEVQRILAAAVGASADEVVGDLPGVRLDSLASAQNGTPPRSSPFSHYLPWPHHV